MGTSFFGGIRTAGSPKGGQKGAWAHPIYLLDGSCKLDQATDGRTGRAKTLEMAIRDLG